MDNKDPYDLNDPDPYDRAPDPDRYRAGGDDEPRDDQADGKGQDQSPASPDADPYDLAYPSETQPPPHPAHNAPPHFVQVACIACGYNLTGVAIGGVCPECGALVDNSLYAAGQSPTNGFAVTSMVIGIVAATMVCCPLVSYLGVIGLVFGILALKQLNTGQYAGGSRGMAIAGIVCSSLATLAALAWTVMIIADL